jgi:hypothetical protein
MQSINLDQQESAQALPPSRASEAASIRRAARREEQLEEGGARRQWYDFARSNLYAQFATTQMEEDPT